MATQRRPKRKNSLVWWSSKELQHLFPTELLFRIKETKLAWLTFHESCNNSNSLKERGTWVYRFVLRDKYNFAYEMKNKSPNTKVKFCQWNKILKSRVKVKRTFGWTSSTVYNLWQLDSFHPIPHPSDKNW